MNGILKYTKKYTNAFHNWYFQGSFFNLQIKKIKLWEVTELPQSHTFRLWQSGDWTRVWLTSSHLLTHLASLGRGTYTHHLWWSQSPFINFQQLDRTLLQLLPPGVHPDPGPVLSPNLPATHCYKSANRTQEKAASAGGLSKSLYKLSPAHLCSFLSAVLRTAEFSCNFKCLHMLFPSLRINWLFVLCFKNL